MVARSGTTPARRQGLSAVPTARSAAFPFTSRSSGRFLPREGPAAITTAGRPFQAPFRAPTPGRKAQSARFMQRFCLVWYGISMAVPRAVSP